MSQKRLSQLNPSSSKNPQHDIAQQIISSITTKEIINARTLLLDWYELHARVLPWRRNRDAYRIWISEIMLQQTTVAAVRPFYERFMTRFPELESLAKSEQTDVIEHWAGLGYYSRARNLHKAAQLFFENGGLPKSHSDLILYPGLGPYTSRAIASIAYGERVGVVDGNVIRILSRMFGLKVEWWKSKNLSYFQTLSDKLADCESSSLVNQGMMELGATVCTPKSPTCILCPWNKNCVAFREGFVQDLPLPKPKQQKTILIWKPVVQTRDGKILLNQNDYAPFLKNQWLLPGEVESVQKVPKDFLFRHSITRYDIFVQPKVLKNLKTIDETTEDTSEKNTEKTIDEIWVTLPDLKKVSPSSLVSKLIAKLSLN